VTFALFLLGCGPVMLGRERAEDAGVKPSDASAPGESADASDPIRVGTRGSASNVHVSVSVEPVNCGKCFDVRATGSGGQAPYEFEWDDGTRRGSQRVCPSSSDITVSVVAQDSAAARSDPQAVTLTPLADAGCPEPKPDITTPPALLCLENPSFEGPPVANLGQPDAFEAEPWSACVSAGMPSATLNTPDIANDTIPQNVVVAPKATDGETYLALGEGEQVSQPFCNTIDANASLSLQLDLSGLDLTSGLSLPEKVFLEIWGGLAVDCSQRELLWASPALEPGWKTFCVTLHPHSFMNQITLRANSDQGSAAPAYLLLDNLKPMDRCP
jgi:hypothetical protein